MIQHKAYGLPFVCLLISMLFFAYTHNVRSEEQQEAWDRLTPEEQSAQLKQLRKDEIQKFAFFAISGILIISGILAYYMV